MVAAVHGLDAKMSFLFFIRFCIVLDSLLLSSFLLMTTLTFALLIASRIDFAFGSVEHMLGNCWIGQGVWQRPGFSGPYSPLNGSHGEIGDRGHDYSHVRAIRTRMYALRDSHAMQRGGVSPVAAVNSTRPSLPSLPQSPRPRFPTSLCLRITANSSRLIRPSRDQPGARECTVFFASAACSNCACII
ncbi:hypothetical protein B0J11DRAFT_81256 [Dendryphion nanum]|uniref:Uncharacterized protein n=1 Tax=Dendryphion nanum TaxID=256645 RepID=A0A9P9DHC4_9PLEO|nr:hypothetical protein B0J11DRAFT_81256 [Dendryphion nanum]